MRPRAIDSPDSGTTDLGAQDGRVAPRRDLASLAWFRTIEVPGLPQSEIVEGVARSIDISRGGFGLVTTQPIPKGALLFLELTLRRAARAGERTQATLHCIARVMHCGAIEEGGHRVGIRVELVPPGERALLEWLVGP